MELAEHIAEEGNVISGYARQPGLGLVHLNRSRVISAFGPSQGWRASEPAGSSRRGNELRFSHRHQPTCDRTSKTPVTLKEFVDP